jgi:Subtilase family
MQPGKSPRPRAWIRSIGALAAAFAVAAPAAALGASTPPGGGDLSPRLAELAKPAVRSAPPAVQARELSLAAEGPGSLLRQGNRVLVDVRFDRGAAAGAGDLRAAGAEIVNVSRRYQTVTVAAKPAELHDLADLAGVASVVQVLTPMTAATCPSGEVVSEGVKQLNAGEGTGEARQVFFPVDGSGVTVGILSDSFDQATEAADGGGPVATHALEDEESGDLPGPESPCTNKAPVDVLEDENPIEAEEAADEGRGMAQIVHDLAPGADIAFASAFNGEISFAENIEQLAEPFPGGAGAQVIADDVFYFEEPFFQDGPIAVAVDEAVEAGATFFSAAGNDNLIDPEGHDIASWETPQYRDAGGCPPEVQAIPGANATHCLDFDPSASVDRTFGIKVEPEATLTVDLQWDEPEHGVNSDFDAFLLNAGGIPIAASEEDNKAGQRPIEVLQWANESASQRTVQLAINRFAGGSPRLKLGLLENGFGVAATEYPRSTGEDVVGPTVFGHSGAAKAISVGAVPFDDSSEVEEYSSRGPVRHDFGPVEGTEAAAPLGSPEILSKPDMAATDCGLTTFFAFLTGDGWRFCGTSAAAPHAAGVAALMLDEEGSATPDEIRAALQASAVEVGAFGPCAVGTGLVEAVGAIEDLLSPPAFTAPECTTPAPEGSVEEARAPGNWGLEAPPSQPSTPVVPATNPPVVTTIDETPPRTFFLWHPPHTIRTRQLNAKGVFRFGAGESGVTFLCRVDGEPFRECGRRFVGRFAPGPHTMRAIARDAAGNADPTPAVYRFRVKRIG